MSEVTKPKLSTSVDLSKVLLLKKPTQVPLPGRTNSADTTPKESTNHEPQHFEDSIEKKPTSTVDQQTTATSEPSSARIGLRKIRKEIQDEIDNGYDQYGVLETIKNMIVALSEEKDNSNDVEDNYRRYSEYLEAINELITPKTHTLPRKKTKPPRVEKAMFKDTPATNSNNNNNAGNIELTLSGNIMKEAHPEKKVSVTAAQKVLIKFLAEEGEYMYDLQRLVEEFLPLVQKENLLSKADEKIIFSTSPELLELHSALYNTLKESLKNPSADVGHIIQDKIGQFSAYLQYSVNFADAAQCLERNLKDSKPFASSIKQLDRKDSQFSSLLQRPLRRVEEYTFAMDAYAKALPPGTKERIKAEDIRDQLQDILDSIEQRENVADNLARVMEIGNSITDLDENLVRPDRRFIFEGPIKVFKRPEILKKPIADYIFIFNDVLIYCLMAGKTYTYVGRLYMHTITFTESSKPNSIDVTNESEKDGKYVLTAQSPADRDQWMLYLGKVIREVERTRKVFGVPLKVLMKREKDNDIPIIVEKSIKFIYDYGIDKEGLFRQTGRSTQIEKLKDQLNQGAKVFFSENMDVHTVATLFKQWLRELPDPLLTWDSYSDFVLAIQQPEDVRDHLLREIIEHLPRENRFVCQHMFKCLHTICENEPKTKMNPNNLAVVFAPNILKNADPNANPFDHHQLDCVNNIFKTLITSYANIFGSIEMERDVRKTSISLSAPKKEKTNENRKSLRLASPLGIDINASKSGDNVIQEGTLNFLEKKKWSTRFVVLKPLSLHIFRTSGKEKKPKYTLDLTNAQLSSAPASGKPFSWVIETVGPAAASYYFSAKSNDEQDEWVKSIKEACQN